MTRKYSNIFHLPTWCLPFKISVFLFVLPDVNEAKIWCEQMLMAENLWTDMTPCAFRTLDSIIIISFKLLWWPNMWTDMTPCVFRTLCFSLTFEFVHEHCAFVDETQQFSKTYDELLCQLTRTKSTWTCLLELLCCRLWNENKTCPNWKQGLHLRLAQSDPRRWNINTSSQLLQIDIAAARSDPSDFCKPGPFLSSSFFHSFLSYSSFSSAPAASSSILVSFCCLPLLSASKLSKLTSRGKGRESVEKILSKF